MSFLAGKSILVTGGVGTVGRELVHQILEERPRELRVIDSNESEVFFLEQQIAKKLDSSDDPLFECNVGDVRDADKMKMATEGVDIIFHVAALKHVTLCERSPFDAVQTNIIGVKNVINAALQRNVEKVIFTSSDKAVNPTNVMGTSKLMGERLMTAANATKGNRRTVFSSTRFGNVLGSRGSVIPLFYRQIREGGPVTLTDADMTRFVMTLQESCRLLLSAAGKARGGEVFITKMPIMRIEDIAETMVEMLAPRFGHDPERIEIRSVGARPGEKLFEELMSSEETRRALELADMFAVLPAFRGVYPDIDYEYPDIIDTRVTDPYISRDRPAMTPAEIRRFFETTGLIEQVEREQGDTETTATPRLKLKRAA